MSKPKPDCAVCEQPLSPQALTSGICTRCWWKTNAWTRAAKRPIRTGMGR